MKAPFNNWIQHNTSLTGGRGKGEGSGKAVNRRHNLPCALNRMFSGLRSLHVQTEQAKDISKSLLVAWKENNVQQEQRWCSTHKNPSLRDEAVKPECLTDIWRPDCEDAEERVWFLQGKSWSTTKEVSMLISRGEGTHARILVKDERQQRDMKEKGSERRHKEGERKGKRKREWEGWRKAGRNRRQDRKRDSKLQGEWGRDKREGGEGVDEMTNSIIDKIPHRQ